MRVFLTWLCDPYLHLLSIGLGLAWLAMPAMDDSGMNNTAAIPTVCGGCGVIHEMEVPCPAVAAKLEAGFAVQ